MQIITGKYRGRKLLSLETEKTRPTLARVKESLFSMVDEYISDKVVLDLFAGSGALGIEALSRGAVSCVLIEKNKKAANCILENLKFTRLKDKAEVMNQDVFTALSMLEGTEPFDCIFMDPPYNKELEKEVLAVLRNASYVTKDTLIVVEASLETTFDYVEEYGFEIVKNKKYKTNRHVFLRKE